MHEMGGYIELEHFSGKMYHENLLELNCGRACLRYLIRQRAIRRIVLPRFCCDSVRHACEQEQVSVRYFSIGRDWLPADVELVSDEWLYVVNYYGQLTQTQLQALQERYQRVIIDNAQAYFDQPLGGVDTLYTCRKFYGVADGAFLATTAPRMPDLPRDESCEHMHFLLGRYERIASEFYAEYAANNDSFDQEDIKRMSPLTENILRAADDTRIRERRTENFRILHEALRKRNELTNLRVPEGAFAYPLLVPRGSQLRRRLIAERIYIPTLWPNVLDEADVYSWEYRLANDVLPLPVDQRYEREDMEYLIKEVEKCIS